MKLEEKDYWLGFNIMPGIGSKRFFSLLKVFGSAKKAWQASSKKLLKTSIPHKIIENFLEFRQKVDLNWEKLRLEKKLIRFIIVEDKEYPNNLAKIKNPPPLLYIKGKLKKQDNFSLAVVGTRKITSYGREVTEKLVAGLVSKGITIVSGLARGVDSVAHRVALGNNGRTIAVLGCGLDMVYPPEHQALAKKIIQENKGALISQLALGSAPLKGNFPQRNRIISGLSLGVLVTEGASISGTKITSNFAFEQKRPVFAVPGPITSEMSNGPAELIKKGAKIATNTDDILEEITITSSRSWSRYRKNQLIKGKTNSLKQISFSNKEEKTIWQALESGKKHIDEIIRFSHLSSAQALSGLTTLELKGMVKNIGGGKYIII